MKTAKDSYTIGKFLPTILILAILTGGVYLGIQVNIAHSEYLHWKSRESVLVKELQILGR